MATLEHLSSASVGALEKEGADLDVDELPLRLVCYAPGARAHIVGKLLSLPRVPGRNTTPLEQFEQIIYEFVVGKPLAYSVDRRKLEPLAQNVWELKTADVRIFGWVPRKACFIVVDGEPKGKVSRFRFYAPYVQAVVAFRDQLDLDHPKAIGGMDYNALF
jgi:hypothetical protein